jgi:hypothetical protein
MAPVDRTFYDLLGVEPQATPDEISTAYRKQALKLHPDKGGSAEEFKAMKAAYDVLKDPQKKQLYDSYGPAVLRAMEGEVLDPQVMKDVMLTASRTASRMLLWALPFLAALLLFPPVAISLKWDGRVSWNWNLVFVPVWLAQIVLLLLVYFARRFAAGSVAGETEGEDHVDEAEKEEKKNVKRFFTIVFCIVLSLIVQEALFAGKLQGYLQASWFVALIPYFVLELLYLTLRVHPMLQIPELRSRPLALAVLMVPILWWTLLRLCSAMLLAAKAEQDIACSWLLCLIPLMIGAGVKVLWAACQPSPPQEESEATSRQGAFLTASFSIASWLTFLILAAQKMDGSTYSAFLVFLPVFLSSGALLCCCTCLACCGPMLFEAAVDLDHQEQAAQRAEQNTEGQPFNTVANDTKNMGYSTMPAATSQEAPV